MMRIGIVGMSPGNAHPYSWSSIINGCFDGKEITRIGYPAVADYLVANRDTLGIPGAKVTHVWSQERQTSESIAGNSKIEHVVDRLEDMAGEVDAVILGRDDPQNHVAMATPFLEAGVPIFIDKPLAISREELDWFAGHAANGRFLMSCSSMRYANECRSAKSRIRTLGKIALVTGVGKKDWIKYGVHLLEAVFSLLDDPRPLSVRHVGEKDRDIVHLELENGLQVVLHLFMDITSTFQLSLFGSDGWTLVDIRNSYSMFRDNIIEFIRSVEEGKPRLSFHKTEQIIKTLITARESLQQEGRKLTI
jgi:predicted dehydrogenase